MAMNQMRRNELNKGQPNACANEWTPTQEEYRKKDVWPAARNSLMSARVGSVNET